MGNQSGKTRVVIVGGGFGGLRAAEKLGRQRGLDVTLISNLTTFAYYPQFYHSATGGSRSEAALPLEALLAGTGVRLVQDVIVKIDPASKTVLSEDGHTNYPYDELIIALGCVTNYFGIKGLSEFSYGVKSIEETERFKLHLHQQLLAEHKPDLNYVIVGAGPTGVELAASLGTYLKRIMKLHGIEQRDYHIEIVEAAPRILPRSSEAVSKRVRRQLEKLGVEVFTGAAVKAETAEALELEGQSISTRTVVWTAGTSVNPFFYANGDHFQLAKGGRVMVSNHLEGKEHVYVIGDNAATPFSGMAQTAIRDAGYVAADIIRTLAGRDRPAYEPRLPVSVIPVGENWAAAEWGRLRIYGLAGFALRRAADLVGYADVEPWPQAVRSWLQDSKHEDDCGICAGAKPAAAPQTA